MKQFANFVFTHFDIILALCILLCAAFSALSKRDAAGKREGAPPFKPEQPVSRQTLRKRSWQVILYIPLMTAGILLAFGHISNLIPACLLILAYLMVSLFLFALDLKHTSHILLHSDISTPLQKTWANSCILISMVLLGRIVHHLPAPSWSIPLVYYFLCINQISALYQLWLSGRDEAAYLIPPLPRLTFACMQAVLSWGMWALGRYWTGLFLGHRTFLWADWLQTVFLYSTEPFCVCMRICGILLLVLTLVPVFAIALQQLRLCVFPRQQLQLLLPPAATLGALAVLWGYLLSVPNYIQTLSVPMNTWLGTSIQVGSAAENYRAIDGLPMVLENDGPIYLDMLSVAYGESYFVTVTPLDDFSSRPYLRFYAQTVGDGSISVWAENQGGVPAENCSFRLTDHDGVLKSAFPKELLRTNADTIGPGEAICLFTLGCADMRQTIYEEFALELEVAADFTSRGQHLRLRKSIPGSLWLGMQGIYLSPDQAFWSSMQELAPGGIVEETGYLQFDYLLERILSVDCSQTMLVDIRVAIRQPGGDTTILPPVALIYECP